MLPVSLLVSLGLLLWLCAAARIARADPPATQSSPQTQPAVPPASIKLWFDQLADADPDTRDDAVDQLMAMTRGDLPALCKIVQEELPLAPTQDEALRRVVCQVYLAGEPYELGSDAGFLGIQTEPVKIAPGNDQPAPPDGTANVGVLVVSRVAGFCAARVLHNGDVIIGIGDSAQLGFSNDPSSFKDAVMRHSAGSLVHFHVLRRGKVRDIAIALDHRPAVADGANPDLSLFTQDRQALFDQYWSENFAPLLKEEVSSTGAQTAR
jgi:hypothetical protein